MMEQPTSRHAGGPGSRAIDWTEDRQAELIIECIAKRTQYKKIFKNMQRKITREFPCRDYEKVAQLTPKQDATQQGLKRYKVKPASIAMTAGGM